MAGAVKLGGTCPLCREKGREGLLELRQINASEALWICGNLRCPYPMYMDVLTVTSVVPELLPKEFGTTAVGPIFDQNTTTATTGYYSSTTGDHCSRNMAAGADQSDQMAEAASSPKFQNFNSSSSTSAIPNPQNPTFSSSSSSFSKTMVQSNYPTFTSQGSSALYPQNLSTSTSSLAMAAKPNDPHFYPSLSSGYDQENILDELSALFDGQS